MKDSLVSIRKVLDHPVNPSLGDSIFQKMTMIMGVMGLSVECCARAEVIYNAALVKVELDSSRWVEQRKADLKNNVALELINLRTAEGYNKELHYQIEMLRGMLSKLKQEEQANSYGSGQV